MQQIAPWERQGFSNWAARALHQGYTDSCSNGGMVGLRGCRRVGRASVQVRGACPRFVHGEEADPDDAAVGKGWARPPAGGQATWPAHGMPFAVFAVFTVFALLALLALLAVGEVGGAGGTSRAIAHTKPASSRATATVATELILPASMRWQ